MSFLTFDLTHIIMALVFVILTITLLCFQIRRHTHVPEKINNSTMRKNFFVVRIVALVLSVIILGVVFLTPTGFVREDSYTRKGIDCIWLLDTSLSMGVEDIKTDNHTVSRLAKAKSIIEDSMMAHPENRYGLMIFAGKARLVSPVTTEHSSILSFLSNVDSKSIQEGGTDFKEAVSSVLERFSKTDDIPHAIVLLSDGGDPEDLDSDAVKSLFQGKKATLITVGIGQVKPSPIPTGTSPFGEMLYKNFHGETVVSGLNRETLKNLASIGKGAYMEASDRDDMLGSAFRMVATHDIIVTSQENTANTTVRLLVFLSLIFFLIFLLLPSFSLKQGNAL